MNKTIMNAIRAQALEESPRECCGLVIQSGRRQRYVPAPNSHENPTEHFRIDAEHWANAEDAGTIIRVIHSHPGDGSRPIPSDLDRQQCNQSGVVWGIYAPDADEYAEITPDAIPLNQGYSRRVQRHDVLGQQHVQRCLRYACRHGEVADHDSRIRRGQT